MIAKLDITINKNNCINDLIGWHDKNDQLKHLFSGLFKILDLVF